MGEKKRRLDRMKREHPQCIYCGGIRPTETIDHMPPAILFNGKLRPKGLEMPACQQCNNSTGSAEQIVALITRFASEDETGRWHNEFVEIMNAVRRNHPGLVESMMPSLRERRTFLKKRGYRLGIDATAAEFPLVKLSDQRITDAFTLFGRKLASAIHFNYTQIIVPPDGWIFVRSYSNVELAEKGIPDNLLSDMSDITTLKQGDWHVVDQFVYRYVISHDGLLSKIIAGFRHGFGIAMLVNASKERDEAFFYDGKYTFPPFS